jgi:succinyl-CoA synthetase alpha subunit
MTNEQKAERLEEIANYKMGCDGVTISILREAAQLMRERGTLLTGPDWKTMYEAQERDMAALRQEQEGAIALLVKFIKQAGVAE